jgi:subtilisin family serine protease
VTLCLALFATLLPGAPIAAAERRGRTYIVSLATVHAGSILRLSQRADRLSARQRATQSRATTKRLAARYDIRVRHRYTTTMAGFSARLSAAEAARLRRDGEVVSVRPARRFRLASEVVPDGVRRVKAAPVASPTPDVDADIAIIDTGIGPVGGGELNIIGGVNCSGDGQPAEAWQDPIGHGTHVAGIAAARDGNGIGVVGTAPGARLWAIRIFDATGLGDEASVLCGLDWVTATRVPGLAPLGSQPIEVANMSIEGSRIGLTEDCVPGDPDLFHVAVCAAMRAGITIVAAAGNSAIDAGAVAPAGYDQVITVGALSDLDGAGWGAGSSGCYGEHDDTWASYSNYGRDIDVLAPGSCVVSLRPSDTGDVTERMTGTSMAAPHVAGAAARFLATHPSSPPGQVAKLVRAAGRLDWHTRTDPSWSGVADRDGPSRLLDVSALLGPPQLRVWVSTDSFRYAGERARRQARVDVQRGGGYAGGVRLKVVGLRPAVGSARFDRPGARLKGLNGLGARLEVRLTGTSGTSRRSVSIAAEGQTGIPTASRPLALGGRRGR